MNKSEVLDKAKGLINNDRCKEYGSPYDNFTRIANMWTILLEKVLGEGKHITPGMVANCMISVKQTRLVQTETHEDSWIDIAGYAGCGGEVVSQGEAAVLVQKGVFYAPNPHHSCDKTISHWGAPLNV